MDTRGGGAGDPGAERHHRRDAGVGEATARDRRPRTRRGAGLLAETTLST